jgi:integrating conjugative element protein (TIGR03761 family)
VRIISLQHFSELMRAIWVTASQDDPCADWYLVRVLEGIEQARLELSRLHQEIQERLQRVQGIEIQMAQFVAPVRVPLRFGTPYSYLGACLIADYDPWVCAILTAQHVGVLSRDTGETLRRRGARLIRRVFMIPLGWKPLTVIREDLQQNNLCARQARETMGELPNGIFAGTRRARIAPAIRKSSVVNDAVKKNTDIEGSYRDQTDGI